MFPHIAALHTVSNYILCGSVYLRIHGKHTQTISMAVTYASGKVITALVIPIAIATVGVARGTVTWAVGGGKKLLHLDHTRTHT